MSAPTNGPAAPPRKPPEARQGDTTGLTTAAAAVEEQTEQRFEEIEMLGEEAAADFPKGPAAAVSPGMRYLHCSRTIHQLIQDRNRAVGLYLAVASLLLTASSSLLHATSKADMIVPLEVLQRWCFPVTFGTLALLSLFTGFLLIRTRVGLIFEVAKMNALQGLPVGRVRRVNVFSLFFIMHLVVSLAGGGFALLFAYHLAELRGPGHPDSAAWAVAAGLAVFAGLVVLYVASVSHTTTEPRLRRELQ